MWETLCGVSRKFIIFATEIFGKREPQVFKTTGNYHNPQLRETRRPKLTLDKRRGHLWFSAISRGNGRPPVVCCIPMVLSASFLEN